ncbi:MAG: cytochrome c oxidase assembly protein [Pseudomonadota bacterium]
MKKFIQDNSVGMLSAKFGAVAVLMFCFALFVMPPLYDLFCDITGLNGKTAGAFAGDVSAIGIDKSRTVRIQFMATNNENMPWEFEPLTRTINVHPGEPTVIKYRVYNTTANDMVAQAVPSLVPFKAANYFHKTECFCFNQQPLAAGESAELGLSFIVDIDVPKQVKTITLSYTLFDITQQIKPVKNTQKAWQSTFVGQVASQ